MEEVKITLAAARVNAGLKQAEVANFMHVSKRTVVNWEKGKIIPSFASLNTLSILYKIPLEYIFLPTKST